MENKEKKEVVVVVEQVRVWKGWGCGVWKMVFFSWWWCQGKKGSSIARRSQRQRQRNGGQRLCVLDSELSCSSSRVASSDSDSKIPHCSFAFFTELSLVETWDRYSLCVCGVLSQMLTDGSWFEWDLQRKRMCYVMCAEFVCCWKVETLNLNRTTSLSLLLCFRQ